MFSSPITIAAAMKLPDKVAFVAFGFEVYWYGLLLAISVILAIVLAYVECKRREMNPDTAVDLCLIALPCGVIGARIGYVLFNLSSFRGRAVEMLYLWDGGLSAIGAVVLALIGFAIYAAKRKVRLLKLLDVVAPAVTAALAVSGWGHFFNQDFYGAAVTKSALKWFPLCVRLDDGSIHLALFFYLFIWLVLLFAYLWLCLRKNARHDGDATLAFVLLYSFAMAILSALRKDVVGGYLTQQIIAAALFVIVLLFLLIRSLREKRLGKHIWPTMEEEETEAEESETDESDSADEEAETGTDDKAPKEAKDEDKEAEESGEESEEIKDEE